MWRRTYETKYKHVLTTAAARKFCNMRLSSLVGINAAFNVFVKLNIRYDIYEVKKHANVSKLMQSQIQNTGNEYK